MRTRTVPLAVLVALLVELFVQPGAAQAQISLGADVPRTWAQDAQEAALSYADSRIQEELQKRAKATILAQYKKLYASGANKKLVRALGEVALSAEEIDRVSRALAQAWHSGDADSVRDASQQVAQLMGHQLTKGIRDPKLRMQLRSALGSTAEINQVATVLGEAAGGDPQAAAEYAGRALIRLTPGAQIFAAAETSIGVMRYAGQQFMNSEVEALYRDFAEGRASADAIRERLALGGYAYIVRQQKIALRAEREASIRRAGVEPTDEVLAHLTAVSDHEVVEAMVGNFIARAERERNVAEMQPTREAAQAEAANIIGELARVCDGSPRGADGPPVDLQAFLEVVRKRLANDDILDPDCAIDQRAMAHLVATRVAYGPASDEYRAAEAEFERGKREREEWQRSLWSEQQRLFELLVKAGIDQPWARRAVKEGGAEQEAAMKQARANVAAARRERIGAMLARIDQLDLSVRTTPPSPIAIPADVTRDQSIEVEVVLEGGVENAVKGIRSQIASLTKKEPTVAVRYAISVPGAQMIEPGRWKVRLPAAANSYAVQVGVEAAVSGLDQEYEPVRRIVRHTIEVKAGAPVHIAGRWTGTFVIREIPGAEGCSPEVLQQLEALKGQPLGLTFNIQPASNAAGQMTLQVTPPPGSPAQAGEPQTQPYRYENGTITVQGGKGGTGMQMQGTFAQATKGWTLNGSWQAYGEKDGKRVVIMTGTWSGTNPNAK